MSITIKELAKICNVSRGTIDRALNGRPGISNVTRARIEKAALEHNYRPHLIAASLSRGKSMTIGVVVFDLKNSFFSQMSNIISLNARAAGYFTYFAISEKDIEAEIQILNNLASRRVDGIIMLPITQGREYIQQLKALGIPVVTMGNHLVGIPHVSINDYTAACDGADYIAQAGYRHIVFICPPLRKKGSLDGKMNITSQDLRAQGFNHYIDMNTELRSDMLIGKDYREKAAAIVRSPGEKTAFFCSSDVYALELLKYFRQEGIKVPADAGLMGFDNLDMLGFISPLITTVSTSIEKVGSEAMRTLLKLIAGETVPATTYIPHVICPGETL
jgi:LacI family transcriptional regulator